MNFIKVIRVAKLVDTSNRFKSSSSSSSSSRSQVTILGQDKGRRKILINQQREILDKMVALTLKTSPLPVAISIVNKKIAGEIKEENESDCSRSKSSGSGSSSSSGGSRVKGRAIFQAVNSKRSSNSRLNSNNSRLNSKSNLLSQRNSVVTSNAKRNSHIINTFKNNNIKNAKDNANLKTEENLLLPDTVRVRRQSSVESENSNEGNKKITRGKASEFGN
jgi:hypothetical protein